MAEIPLGQKFHTKSHFMDTVERRSPQLNRNVETYTMQDIVDTVGGNISVAPTADASSIFQTQTGMTSDADLVVGDIIETRGYTTAGDGGAAIYIVSATGTADGGSTIALDNGLFAVTDFGGITCPTQWGAVKNSSASASENVTAYNSMFGYIESLGGDKCSVNVSTGEYHLNADVFLPRAIVFPEDAFHINFNNSELVAAANDITLLKREYYSAQESSRVSILDCNFRGTGFTGVTGVDIQGGYNCQILNGDYTAVAKGIELGFALNTHMSNLKFTSALRGVNIGLKNGNTNAQSNVTTMYKCRFYSAKTTDYAVHIDKVSGVVIEDCIFEGHQPTGANIFFDGQSSVVNDCTIIGCHAESAGHANSGDNTHVEYTGGARLKLQRVFAQATNTFVDPNNVVSGRELLHMYGGNCYVDMSLYYYTLSFSIRNDTNGYFHMSDAQLNTTLPSNMNTTPLTWTGNVGEPLYFAIERANDGIAISRGRAIQSSDTGGGVTHNHFLKNSGAGEVDVFKAKKYQAWIGSYEGNISPTLYGSAFYQHVGFDQKAFFTNDNYNVGSASHGDLKTPMPQKLNSVSIELESGETGRHEHTLCAASGRPTVYTTTGVPSSATDTGKQGEIRSDATHMYICIADDTWIKSALTSF